MDNTIDKINKGASMGTKENKNGPLLRQSFYGKFEREA